MLDVRRTYLLSFGFVLFQRGITRQSSPPLSSQHTPAASVRKSGREIDDFRPTLFRHTSLDCLLSYIYYIYINIFCFVSRPLDESVSPFFFFFDPLNLYTHTPHTHKHSKMTGLRRNITIRLHLRINISNSLTPSSNPALPTLTSSYRITILFPLR